MKTSGLILDVYDDADGMTLKAAFDSQADIPPSVKVGHSLSLEERNALPDDVFALVLREDGETIRKFACVDQGNTELSMLYFLDNGHKLDPEAQQKTAENFLVACSWYNLEAPEEIQKIAISMDKVRHVAENANGMVRRDGKHLADRLGSSSDRMSQIAFGAGAKARHSLPGEISEAGKKHMAHVEEKATAAKKILQRRASSALNKSAGIGSFLVNKAVKNPISTAMTVANLPSQVKGVSQKVKSNLVNVRAGEANAGGSIGGFDAFHKQAEAVGTRTMPLSAKTDQPQYASKAVVKSAMTSIERDQPYEAPTQKKIATLTAMADGRYPLDSYVEVKQAAEFFDSFAGRMTLGERREFAVNLHKRASDLAIPVSEKVAHYGSTERATEDEWQNGYLSRRENLQDQTASLRLLDKVAEQRSELEAEKFAELLTEFDKVTNLHHYYDWGVVDPVLSSFTKQASLQGLNTSDDEFREVIKGTYVSAKHLADFALTHRREIDALFGSDFADKFQKDPVGTYKGLHDRRRVLIANLVTDNAPGTGVTA